MNKKKILILMMAFALLLSGCNTGSKGNAGEVATVDGVGIPQETFDLHYKIQRENIVSQMGEEVLNEPFDNLGRTAGEVIRTNILDNLIANQVALNAAKDMELGDVDATTDEQIAMEKASTGEEQFKTILESLGITEEQYRNVIKDDIIIKLFRDKKMEEYEVTEEEVQAFYDENKDYLVQAEARHILVETEEEANNVLKRLENGEDFADLAMELSKDPGSAVQGGSLGYFPKGQMAAEFDEFVFSSEVGQISEPIESTYGYHIIEVTGFRSSIDDYKTDIEMQLKSDKFAQEIETLQSKAKIKKIMDPAKEPQSILDYLETQKTEEPEVKEEEKKEDK